MKLNNFLRFYVLFFVVACLFIYGFTQLYKQFVAPPLYHIVNVEDVFSALQENDLPEFQILSRSDLQLDEHTVEQLNNQEIIAFEVGDRSFYLKALNDSQYLKWGPIQSEAWTDTNDSAVLLLFYSFLALVFFALFRPLFRDVAHLQHSAIEFGKKPTSQPLTIKSNSSVFPLAKSLHKMSHQLLEQIQIHKDLSNIIAHEVRTPLSRMKFVLQRIGSDIPDKQLQRLKTDIKELEVLAHEYLEFGRSQITDDDYLQPTNVNDFIEHIEDKYSNVEPTIIFKDIDPKLAIDINWYQMDLAVSNLINNATRYAVQEITVYAESDNKVLNIVVEDDGPGFTNTQKASADGNNHQGFGLGLYIVKQVAARHNGKFVISEAVNQGAKMVISLPQKVLD